MSIDDLICHDLEPHESVPMFKMLPDLAARVKQHGLEKNVRELREHGFTIVEDVIPPEMNERLRQSIMKEADIAQGAYFGMKENARSADMLLDKDRVFGEAVIHEKIMPLVEFLCGQNPVFGQLSGSYRSQGANAMQLHVDQAWMPSPFPEHNALATACWYCDDIDEESSGATKIIPNTQTLKRSPSEQEIADSEDKGIPILCKAGSVAVWDGSIWHGNYPRTQEGDRVLLHATYLRLAYRPLEVYTEESCQKIIAEHGEPMAKLLGKKLWFGNHYFNDGSADLDNLLYSMEVSKQ